MMFFFCQETEQPHQGNMNTILAIPNTSINVRYQVTLDLVVIDAFIQVWSWLICAQNLSQGCGLVVEVDVGKTWRWVLFISVQGCRVSLRYGDIWLDRVLVLRLMCELKYGDLDNCAWRTTNSDCCIVSVCITHGAGMVVGSGWLTRQWRDNGKGIV